MKNSWRTLTIIAITLLFLAGGGFVAFRYFTETQTVYLQVNNHQIPLKTQTLTVAGVLAENEISLHPLDQLSPTLASPLTAGQTITLTLARPVTVYHNNTRPQHIYTQKQTPADILTELNLPLSPGDALSIADKPWQTSATLPLTPTGGLSDTLNAQINALRPAPVNLKHRSQMTITLALDDNRPRTLATTRQNVGDLLQAMDVAVYQGDMVVPALSSPLQTGLTVTVQHAAPVTLHVDGHTWQTRTLKPTVGRALAEAHVILSGQDYTIPAETATIQAVTDTIRVVRIHETLEFEEETSDYETNWIPDPEMALDQQRIDQPGQKGIKKTRSRATYKDGQRIGQVTEETWLAQEPQDKIIAYGTDVVIGTVETEEGPLEYWRKIRVLATSYTEDSAYPGEEKPSWFGLTRTGLPVRRGIIAVDPKVIGLLTEVYVPGYGKSLAADTGGAIIGKHIDLAYDSDETLEIWYKWVDIYLLTPVPAEYREVLPQWPQER